MKTNKLLMSLMGFAAIAMTACEKTDRSFSLLDAGSSFQQAATYVPRKIDILWVIDNSGSMNSSQTNLTNSFQTFISKFQQNRYDFHMAVTGSDAWRGMYQTKPEYKNILLRARPGKIDYNSKSTTFMQYLTNSGFHVMDLDTPDLVNVFLTNASQGVTGTGDERSFSSFKDFLSFEANIDFRRPDAVLAVIIVSDEDDFSANTSSYVAGAYREETSADPLVLPPSSTSTDLYNLYRDSRLTPVSSYKEFLDQYAGPGNYSVNMIGILDQQCKESLNNSFGGRRIGRRYIELADMTGGVKTSLCGNFGESLKLISDSIISLSAVFKLDREPVPETLKVIVNGVEISRELWSYDPAAWTITFKQGAEPAEGDNVQILFTPVRADY